MSQAERVLPPQWRAVGLSLWLLGCQDEYPLAPTACDDWCQATGGHLCTGSDSYRPAECVAHCEAEGFAYTQECQAQFLSTLACYRNAPPRTTPLCTVPPVDPLPECSRSLSELSLCDDAFR